jgi:hypothetical protein
LCTPLFFIDFCTFYGSNVPGVRFFGYQYYDLPIFLRQLFRHLYRGYLINSELGRESDIIMHSGLPIARTFKRDLIADTYLESVAYIGIGS